MSAAVTVYIRGDGCTVSINTQAETVAAAVSQAISLVLATHPSEVEDISGRVWRPTQIPEGEQP